VHFYLRHASLSPPHSAFQTASRSIQSFLHSSRQRVPILYNGPPLSPSKLLFRMGIWTPSITWFLGLTRVHNPNSILIGSAVFEGLTIVTYRQTDIATPSVTISRIYLVLRCDPKSSVILRTCIFVRCYNAGRSLQCRRSFSIRSAGSRDLLQWSVGLQRQRRRRRLFVLKAEAGA